MAHEFLSRSDVEAYLADRASVDEEFRAELLANPKAVISREFRIGELPESLSISVVQETPNALYIVLPADPRQAGPVLEARLPLGWWWRG